MKFYLDRLKNIPFLIIIIVFFYSVLVGLSSCAKIGSPSGGDYDRNPPRLKDAYPKPNTTNFKGNKFEVEFDEFIVLSNTSEELIISPPLKNKPTIKSNLKTLFVSWTDSLEENTTYIFDFGSSIVDFTEGNKLNNFTYSFSTGSIIDTNEYKGRLLDAYTHKPIAKKYVMLYKSNDSSIVSREKPNYLTRTDSNGNYHFQNIASGNYQILALDDKNQNLLYDLNTEPIAFSSKRIESTSYKRDSTQKKSFADNNLLYFYEPKDTLINLNSSKILSNYRFQLTFSNPTTDSLRINFIYPSFLGKEDTNIFFQLNPTKDTIDIWSLNKTFDSIKLVVMDIGLKEEIEQYYTIHIKEKKKDTFNFIAPNNNQPFYSKCLIEMPFPIKDTTQTIEAFRFSSKDTSKIIIKPSLKSPLFFQIEDELEQGSFQKIKIPQGKIKNKLGQINDSLVFVINVDKESDYGNFFINVEDTAIQNAYFILILEDLSGKEIVKKYSGNKEKLGFINLKEGSYKLKIIIDKNNNHKWDYGDYKNQILPEEIYYFGKVINVRKNWDIEEIWRF